MIKQAKNLVFFIQVRKGKKTGFCIKLHYNSLKA